MHRTLVKLYKELLDKKINHTILVLLIILLILMVWIFVQKTDANYYLKSNILESSSSTYITIEWVKYKITIQK